MKTLKIPVAPTGISDHEFKETFNPNPVLNPKVQENKHPSPAKILMISDQPKSRSVLRKELQAAHYDVIAAESEAEGMRLAARIRPDLVLLDLKVPLNDKWTRGPLNDPSALRSVPLIFLTDEDGHENNLPGLGRIDYVVKPIRPKELRARIRKAMVLREEQQKFFGDVQKFKGRFVALVSNELRNHVTVIAGFAALLEQKSARLTPSAQRGYLQEIIQHADHLADLTDGFECLLHSKGLVEKVDLYQTVSTAVEKMRPLYRNKDQTLILKTPESRSISIQGHSRELIIAVGHLLSYVHRHTIPGGAISVEFFNKGQQGRIEVNTPALAISPEQEDRVSVVGEMDLGLAIAQWVAEQQGGTIGIERHPGRGHCFWMVLPLPFITGERAELEDKHEHSISR